MYLSLPEWGLSLFMALLAWMSVTIMLVWPTYRIRILRRWQYRND